MSNEIDSAITLQSNKNAQPGSETSASYEVFRNNTTAVEVIVKEVPKRSLKQSEKAFHVNYKIKSLQEEVEVLKRELNESDMTLERIANGFRRVISEMKKQLDIAGRRESDACAKNVALQLENEKLATLLESKTGFVVRLKYELQNMKRTLKLVMKSINYSPKVPENFSYGSDVEYNEFENSLKRGIRVKFANLFDGTGNSTLSRDT